MQRFLHYIDIINIRIGKLVSFFVLPLMVIVMLEVVLRYVFNRPTIWAWDVNVQLLATIMLLGVGCSYLEGAHVCMDLFVNRLSLKKRAVIDMATSFLFFAACAVLLWKGTEYAWTSVKLREHVSTIWSPPIYHVKVMLPVGVFLLLVQGIARFIRNFITATQSQAEAGHER